MNRRDFLRTAGGATAVASAAAATGASAAQEGGNESAGNETTGTPGGNESSGNESSGEGGGGGGGTTKEVTVGPGGDLTFEPAEVYVAPGDTVHWTWDSDDHNIVVEEQPDDADWGGTEGSDSETYDTGHEYSNTFDTIGEYAYFCQPHKSAGMEATVVVNESGQAPGAGAGGEADPEHMGVPFQAHFVGISTVVMIFVSLVFTFFTLKYGESRHASGGNN